MWILTRLGTRSRPADKAIYCNCIAYKAVENYLHPTPNPAPYPVTYSTLNLGTGTASVRVIQSGGRATTLRGRAGPRSRVTSRDDLPHSAGRRSQIKWTDCADLVSLRVVPCPVQASQDTGWACDDHHCQPIMANKQTNHSVSRLQRSVSRELQLRTRRTSIVHIVASTRCEHSVWRSWHEEREALQPLTRS